MAIEDYGPIIVGVTWWLTFFSAGFLGLRLYAKLSRHQGLWWDDHILIVSWVLLLVESALTQAGQSLGFGKRTINVPVQNMMTIAMMSSVTATISCVASTFSKISFGVTLLRLIKGKMRWFVWFCIITLFLIMIPSAVNPWVQCRPMEKAWNADLPGTCFPPENTIRYGIFNAAWCAAADFALALLPWYLLWGLQLNRREKLGVGIAMSIGILSGVCAIVKGVYVIQLRQEDFFYNGKDVTIWTAVETAAAIIAASIPVLRVFFKEKVSTYQNSRSKGTVPLSKLNRSQLSKHTATVSAMGKEGGWTTLGPIEEDRLSQRGILGDEESGRRTGGRSSKEMRQDGIFTTKEVSVTVGQRRSESKNLW